MTRKSRTNPRVARKSDVRKKPKAKAKPVAKPAVPATAKSPRKPATRQKLTPQQKEQLIQNAQKRMAKRGELYDLAKKINDAAEIAGVDERIKVLSTIDSLVVDVGPVDENLASFLVDQINKLLDRRAEAERQASAEQPSSTAAMPMPSVSHDDSDDDEDSWLDDLDDEDDEDDDDLDDEAYWDDDF